MNAAILKLKPTDAHAPEVQALCKQALQLLEQLESVKPLYADLDTIIMRLHELGFESAECLDGETLELVSNFIDPKTGAARNTVFRPAGVKQFELKLSRGAK